jgi:predicted hotdog family 3-hydroxylacyl-ACP dehydratase
MLLLDRLVDIGPDFAVCEWQVSDSNIFASPDLGVPAYIGVEYMAQCIAVLAGARARAKNQQVPLGYLLGTRSFRSSITYFPVGLRYQVVCRELIHNGFGMRSYECEITQRGGPVAQARLNVLEAPQGETSRE